MDSQQYEDVRIRYEGLDKHLYSANDSKSLQKDLDSLTTWSKEWFLHLNPDKCKVVHIGHKFDTKYYTPKCISGERLTTLKPSVQCQTPAAKARSVGLLGIIRRNFRRLMSMDSSWFTCHTSDHILNTLCMQVWSPYHKKDIQCLENVHRASDKTNSITHRATLTEHTRNNHSVSTKNQSQRWSHRDIKSLQEKSTLPVISSILHTGSHNTRCHSLNCQFSALDSIYEKKRLFQYPSRQNL